MNQPLFQISRDLNHREIQFEFQIFEKSRFRKKKRILKYFNFLVSKARRLKWDVATRNEFHLTVRLSVQRADKDVSKKPENKFNTGTHIRARRMTQTVHLILYIYSVFSSSNLLNSSMGGGRTTPTGSGTRRVSK